MLALALAALAAPPTADEAARFRDALDQAHADRVVPAPQPGSRKLDLYQHGDLAILHDADGEWWADLLERGADLDWALGTVHDRFYMDYADEYQYLTILLVRDFNIFAAFYSPTSNDVSGIGYQHEIPQETFDLSDTQVEGMIFMNYYGLWYDSVAEGRYVFGQEFMHRWGSFVHVSLDGQEEDVLLGRDLAHWSYWMDTPNSPMEGNAWTDNGDGTFTTDAASGSTYSDLDLYLMGLVGPEDVGEQRILVPTTDTTDRGETPVYLSGGNDVTAAATEIPFGLDAITAIEGERVPSADDSPKTFKMAFLVLVLDGDVADDATLAQVDELRQRWEADWEADVLGLADLDTTLGEGTAPEWGAPVEDTGDTGDTGGDALAEEEVPAGCGCATGGASAGAWLLGLAALGLGRRRR